MMFGRRTFLRSLGLGVGASLLTPFMKYAHAQSCFDAPAAPRRVVIVMQGNGIEGHNFMSAAAKALADASPDSETILTADDLSAPALGALAGGAGQLDLIPHAAALHRVSSKIAGGGHTSEFKALSCSKGRQETFDGWLARQLHHEEPFDALRLGVTQSKDTKLQYKMCISSTGRELPIIANPVDGHATLFGSIAAGAGGREFATQRELLDFAHGDITAALQTFPGSSRERAKLEAYLAALEELRAQQDKLIGVSDCLGGLATGQGFEPGTGAALSHDHPLTRLGEQFRLATTALIGQLTNVALITNSVGYAFSHTRYTSLQHIFERDESFSGTIPWRHGVAHRSDASPEVCQQVLDRVIEFQVEQIAKMARALASVPEQDGTMLDHTVILFMSDNGDTHHSTAGNWPMLLVGGGALGLQTGGKTLVFPQYGKSANPRVSNVFNTLGHVIGAPLDDWGGEPDRVERGGPISELLT